MNFFYPCKQFSLQPGIETYLSVCSKPQYKSNLTYCRELVDKNPSPHTCLLLGDAYMSIQEVS